MKHKNKNHESVALAIHDNGTMQKWALDCIAKTRTIHGAAQCFLDELVAAGITQTPDGVRYTFTTIKATLKGLK